jgi:DNA repair protein RadD
VEVFKVDHITYSRHEKQGRPPMMKVTYYCGLRSFSEYVCVEHDGFAGRKARQWWRERTDLPFPAATGDALEVAPAVRTATHLRIWINKQYPEILAHCFDGKAFGQQQDATQAPTVDTAARHAPRAAPPLDDMDDDIPF